MLYTWGKRKSPVDDVAGLGVRDSLRRLAQVTALANREGTNTAGASVTFAGHTGECKEIPSDGAKPTTPCVVVRQLQKPIA